MPGPRRGSFGNGILEPVIGQPLRGESEDITKSNDLGMSYTG